MQKPIRLIPEQRTTGALARLDSAKRRAMASAERRETELLPTVNGRWQNEDVMRYERRAPDDDAIALLGSAVEAFYGRFKRLPISLTLNPVTLLEYALSARESRFYYAQIGARRRPIRLDSLSGLDADIVVCQG